MTNTPYFLPMHHVAFIVYPGYELLDASGPASAFNSANRALSQQGQPPFYKVELLSAQGGIVESSSGVAVQTRRIGELRPIQKCLIQSKSVLRNIVYGGIRVGG